MTTNQTMATGTPQQDGPQDEAAGAAGRGAASRRTFLKVTTAGTVGLFLAGQAEAVAQANPRGTGLLDPRRIPQFREEMPRIGVMPHARLADRDEYHVAVRQVRQQMLPRSFPSTPVTAYGPATGRRDQFHSPSLAIEATVGRPTRVTWQNQLVDARGRYLPHLLPVDPTLHWANPGQWPDAMGHRGPDTEPSFAGRRYVPPQQYTDPKTQYTLYGGPVPISTHLHGAVRVGDESDGYPEAWYLPDARNLPAGFARHGRWWQFMAGKARRVHGTAWRRDAATCTYPNHGEAALLWFHDHTMGMTRLNVYAGLAGAYLLRGGARGDQAVRDTRTGRRAVLPGGAGDRGVGDGELSLVVQDRSFRSDGTLFYPEAREFFDEYRGPVIPESDVPPAWQPEFFGNTIIVNGVTWPKLTLQARRYRLRVLNGTQGRALFLDFSGVPGAKVHLIGVDGGLLAQPLEQPVVRLHSAERADVLLDLTDVPVGSHVVRNLGPDAPYGGGDPDDKDFEHADPATTGRVLRLDVRPARRSDPTTPARFLRLPPLAPLPPAVRTRRLALMECGAHAFDGPVQAQLGVVEQMADGRLMGRSLRWMDPVTENPAPGDTEIWEVYNLTEDAHPVHVHQTTFRALDQRRIEVEEHHEHQRITVVDGSVEPARPADRGDKDTVVVPPETMLRLQMCFEQAGQYVWHCHMLEHEDNEMMRPMRVGPLQAGQPADGMVMDHPH